MNRKLFTSIVLRGEGIRLDYYLLEEQREDTCGNMLTCYGVEICQTPLDTFSFGAYLHRSVPDICCSRERITAFLHELSDSRTDPSCLEDIVEELL